MAGRIKEVVERQGIVAANIKQVQPEGGKERKKEGEKES